MLRRLLVNTGSNLVMSANHMVITFIMAPIYVANLGNYDYGLREMLMALTGYLGMLDIGMRSTISRFISMYHARNDRDSLLIIYATSLAFMGLVGLCLAGFFWLWALSWPGLITPEGEAANKYMLFLLLVGAELLFVFPSFVTESCFEGLQRYFMRNNINILSGMLIAVVSYVYMTPENGLLLLTGLVALSTALQLVIFSALLARPAFDGLFPDLSKFSLDKLREMLSFGFKSFIQGVSYQLETSSDRLVIGSILGPATVPVYSIPASLLNFFSGITYTITHAFLPLFSDLDARQQHDQTRQIYLLASKLLVGVLVSAAVAIVIVGGPFIEVWMRGEFNREQVDGIVMLLTLYVLVPKLNPLASRYLTAIGRHGIFAKVAPVAALTNLGLSIGFVFKFGVIGAAMGSVLPVFFIMPIYLRYTCLQLDIPVRRYVGQVILPLLFPMIIMLGSMLWLRSVWGLTTYREIVTCAGAGVAVFLLCYWFVSMSTAERKLVRTWLTRK